MVKLRRELISQALIRPSDAHLAAVATAAFFAALPATPLERFSSAAWRGARR